jgi:hypothetical protein
VTKAVEEYKKIRSDREIRGIARSLANEEALYTQLAQKVFLLLQSPIHAGSLDRRSLDGLGDGTTDFVLSGLREMEELLLKLKADLNNFAVSAVSLPSSSSPLAQAADCVAGGLERDQNKGNKSAGSSQKYTKDAFHESPGKAFKTEPRPDSTLAGFTNAITFPRRDTARLDIPFILPPRPN